MKAYKTEIIGVNKSFDEAFHAIEHSTRGSTSYAHDLRTSTVTVL